MNKNPIGTRKIPPWLIGKTHPEIMDWARKELLGQEPDLDQTTRREIMEGHRKEIFLRPKKKGFYLPTGEFIEALNHSPPIGGDLEKAEEEWDREEVINQWVDKENKNFNKVTTERTNHSLMEYWKHGKRIVEFSESHEISTDKICNALKARGSITEYQTMEHQYCVLFYRWLPHLNNEHPILRFNWKTMAHIVMFGKSDLRICDHVLKQINSEKLNDLTSPEISKLLLDDLEIYFNINEEEKLKIISYRKKLKQKQNLIDEEGDEIKRIIRK
jgi:hypothetical protein